jgi:YbgC/YbaW family acyl-CoA thioester hydrolase
MNRLLRLLWLMLRSPRRAKVAPFSPCLTPFRVWFTDLDPLMHMNNGIYLCIMDLGRLDLMIRSGLWRVINARQWYTVVVAETIQFRRSLNLFQRFVISTRVLGWDEKAIVIEQRFIRGDEVVAHALVRARVLRRSGGNVAPRELAIAAGMDPESPSLDGYAARWNAEQATWQGAVASPG